MDDQSHLDSKYFLGPDVYNCPFCNRRHVKYKNLGSVGFNWSNQKACRAWRVQCESCGRISLHLTYESLQDDHDHGPGSYFKSDIDLDKAFFYSVPTSFFVIDRRIPSVLRELITEAEGCAKMNYLTGASACTRKAIYELLSIQGAEGHNYDEKIKHLALKQPAVDPELFEILGHVKDMTSDHVHEQSWVVWDSRHLHLFLETLKAVLHEIYVVPDEKKSRADAVRILREQLGKARGRASKAVTEGEGNDA